jgi:polyhydroxybutyrate depolymerase
VFAAIAPVAHILSNEGGQGSLGFECAPTRPVPIFHVHGIYDPLVPYNGNPRRGYPSVPDNLEYWQNLNGVSTATELSYEGSGSLGNTTCRTSGEKSNEVTLCLYTEGPYGHTWGSNNGMDPVSGFIWDFFSTKSL